MVEEIVRLLMSAILNETREIKIPQTKLMIIICFADVEKIRAIAAGKISKAVIKNTPTILTERAITSASKIKKDRFQNSVLTPSIRAKSELIWVNKIVLKEQIV